jgi:hypothetical protein
MTILAPDDDHVRFEAFMPFSGMLLYVTLVRTDVSEECIASIIRMEKSVN